LTLHGRIANIPAWYLSIAVDNDVITVKGITDETGLFHPRFRLETTVETKINSNAVTMRDTIVNLKSIPSELQLLYHCNFGEPFLGKNSHLVMPFRQFAPRDSVAARDSDTFDIYKGPTTGYVEQCYYCTPLGDTTGRTCALLRNGAATKGVAVRFNTRQLPCFTLWKNTAAVSDGYVTGLEPATNYPNPKPFERSQGRVVNMPAGSSYKVSLTLEVYDTAAGVSGVEKEIARIQKRAKPVVHQQPVAGLSF